MDAETRHSLKTNELADALERLRKLSDPRVRWALAGVAVVIVLFITWKLWDMSRTRAHAAAWERLSEVSLDTSGGADPVAQLQAMLSEAHGGGFAAAVRLRMGQALVERAWQEPDKKDALLTEAAQMLESVEAAGGSLPLVASAQFLLATVHENLHDVEAARRAYETLSAERFAGSPFQRLAAARLESLSELSEPLRLEPGLPPAPAAAFDVPAPTPDAAAPQPESGGAPPAPSEDPASAPAHSEPGDAPPGGG
jgi:predicted negative regulator of RcsB-dependent stress response